MKSIWIFLSRYESTFIQIKHSNRMKCCSIFIFKCIKSNHNCFKPFHWTSEREWKQENKRKNLIRCASLLLLRRWQWQTTQTKFIRLCSLTVSTWHNTFLAQEVCLKLKHSINIKEATKSTWFVAHWKTQNFNNTHKMCTKSQKATKNKTIAVWICGNGALGIHIQEIKK